MAVEALRIEPIDIEEEVRSSFKEARPPWPHEIDLGLYLSSGPGANS